MSHLQAEDPKECLKTLKQVEQILIGLTKLEQVNGAEPDKRVYSLTLNNFGCYYKK
jgi:hypothetical protein